MTPELPRAPMSEPWAIAPATASKPDSALISSSSAITDSRVAAMLEPVSPSGTG